MPSQCKNQNNYFYLHISLAVHVCCIGHWPACSQIRHTPFLSCIKAYGSDSSYLVIVTDHTQNLQCKHLWISYYIHVPLICGNIVLFSSNIANSCSNCNSHGYASLSDVLFSLPFYKSSICLSYWRFHEAKWKPQQFAKKYWKFGC